MYTTGTKISLPALSRLLVIVAAMAFATLLVPNSVATASSDSATVKCWAVVDGGNGHCYELIETAKNWYDAEAYAQIVSHDGVYGHLATITSDAENDFIHDNVVGYQDEYLGAGTLDVPRAFAWFGGFRHKDSGATSADGWQWVTGETWGDTNWSPGEPNNNFALNVTEFFHDGHGTSPLYIYDGAWNDQNPTAATQYFVVEYDQYGAPVAPTSKSDCKKGGWEDYDGLFKNQGDCVSYVVTGGKNPPSGPNS
ncbi:hypothetical protein [Candidatus Lucifugimonas marina]|uniref:C-type lectin domain-containing protein n=1 Tax=Candidatus Lucifugimonas marina TaxID=3038979 RepID=A0AAJ5ZL58_9CHLR|nr:hypothetical protein [SAR202 cluster bacterium JH702]MDG0870177.1 hypothetical protein [SAR202 cluster bacterium JH639]WFG36270.1 hypothetical protein GKN94_11415 [SAR202 cluster bacterium JH545]WFG40203.1 hypothetical protein GKO48_11450 [SAR202 cluster bacterium JH1073]